MTGPDLIGSTLGQYQVESLIGRGGMGYVYRARDTILGRAVALKVLPPEVVSDLGRLARFTQEARAASALSHPHLVSIYEIREAVPAREGTPMAVAPVHYLAMELVSGETLRGALEGRRLALKRSLELLAQVAEALAAAHAAGIVHRDLKPDNIMVSDSGYAKVLDFGLAKLRPEPVAEGAVTQTLAAPASAPGLLLGTAGYMSPEQAQGHAVDHRSDIFSFGCVLYEAATGARAFPGRTMIDTIHQIINAEPSWSGSSTSDIPPELQRIVRKCLAKDPDDRYQSIKETAIDLRQLLRQLESGSGVAPVPPVSPRPRRMLLWSGVIGAVSVALLVAAWSTRRPAAGPPPETRIERLTASGITIDAVVSPDGKYLAYVESSGGTQSLWVRQVDGTNPLQLIPPRSGGYWGIAFARDSGSIFFAIKRREDPNGSLYRIGLLGGAPERLLTGIDSSVTFSPDGRQLGYLRVDHPAPGDSALMVANVDGSNVRALATRHPPQFFAPGFFVAPSWSPDGSQIVAPVRDSTLRNATLVGVKMDGSSQPIGSPFTQITFTQWLPDGEGIAFIARGSGVSTERGGQVWLQPFPSGDARRLTRDLIDYRNVSVSADGQTMVSVGQDASPVLWSIPLDGKSEPVKLPSLRYDGAQGLSTMPDGRIVFTAVVRDEPQVWLMNADGTERRVLTRDGASASPAPAPDGSFIAFAGSRDNRIGIYRINPDGSGERQVALVPNARSLGVSPDGRWITFTAAIGGPASLWRVAADGGAPVLVAANMDRSSLSPDGTQIIGVRSEGPRYGVAVVPVAGGEATWVPAPAAAGTGEGIYRFAADGQSVYFTTSERTNLWSWRPGADAAVKVTNFIDSSIVTGALSANGRTMLVSRGPVTQDAFLIRNFR